MQDNILSFIGLAKKAGAVQLGADRLYDVLEFGKAKLVLFSSDISKNTEKSVATACEYKEVPIIHMEYTKEQIGAAVGVDKCVAVTFTDTGFARSIAEKLNNEEVRELLSNKYDREKRRLLKKQMGKSAGKRR